MQSTDFKLLSKPVYIVAQIGAYCSAKFLAVTTAILAYAMLYEFISSHVSGWKVTVGVILGTILVYFIVDGGITKMLRYVFKIDRQQADKSIRTFSHFVFIFLILKIAATTTASIWAAPEMANALTSDQAEEQTLAVLLKTDSTQQANKEAALQRVQQLESSSDSRIAKAKKERSSMIRTAVRSGNKWQRESYQQSGFSWIEHRNAGKSNNRYAARIKAAMKAGDELVVLERQRVSQAEDQLTAVAADSNYLATSTLLQQKAKREAEEYEATKQRRKGYIWLADILAMLFLLLCTRMIVLWEKAAGVNAPPRLSQILSAWWREKGKALLDSLEDLLNVDIDGNGVIGTAGTPAATTVSAGTTSSGTDPNATAQVGYNAIKNRTEGDPGTAQAETTGTPAATTVSADVGTETDQAGTAGTNFIKQTEKVDDVSRAIAEQIRRIQRYYPRKWDTRNKGGGKPETIAYNINDALSIIERLAEGQKIDNEQFQKIKHYRNIYLTVIKPELKA